MVWLQDSGIKISHHNSTWKLAKVSKNLAFTHSTSQWLGVKMKNQSWSPEEPSKGDTRLLRNSHVFYWRLLQCWGSTGLESTCITGFMLSQEDFWEEVTFHKDVKERSMQFWNKDWIFMKDPIQKGRISRVSGKLLGPPMVLPGLQMPPNIIMTMTNLNLISELKCKHCENSVIFPS